MNLNNKEFQNLINRYNNDFKADLMEIIETDIENGIQVNDSLDIIINEYFPIWIEEAEDKEIKILLKNYQNEFRKIINL